MKGYLLDVSAYLLLLLPVLLILFILLVEGLILYLFRIGKLMRSIGYAFVANGTSFLFCVFVAGLVNLIGYHVSITSIPLPVLLLFCWLSIIIEAIIIKLLHRTTNTTQVFMASILLNFVTFLFFYLFLLFSH
jgi:hypothetical protein